MVKGIVAFEIEVTDLQAKKKLSQNRTESEKEKIISSLSSSENQNERDIAKYMSQLNEPGK
jgi:transcriptional regulator